MPSIREKYQSTYRDFRSADDIPERLKMFRAFWVWIVEASRTTAAFLGCLIIPIYLITIGALYINNECGGTGYITFSTALIAIGVGLLVCSLYLPIYNRAKKNAEAARANSALSSTEPIIIPMTREEINVHIPFRMHRICNYAFMVVIGIISFTAFRAFRMWDKHEQCEPLLYWTVVVLSIIFVIWLILALFSCLLVCCFCVITPSCRKKERVPVATVEIVDTH